MYEEVVTETLRPELSSGIEPDAGWFVVRRTINGERQVDRIKTALYAAANYNSNSRSINKTLSVG